MPIVEIQVLEIRHAERVLNIVAAVEPPAARELETSDDFSAIARVDRSLRAASETHRLGMQQTPPRFVIKFTNDVRELHPERTHELDSVHNNMMRPDTARRHKNRGNTDAGDERGMDQ